MENARYSRMDLRAIAVNNFGEPDAGNPPVRFDEEGRA
jgi:hypothetical protein